MDTLRLKHEERAELRHLVTVLMMYGPLSISALMRQAKVSYERVKQAEKARLITIDRGTVTHTGKTV